MHCRPKKVTSKATLSAFTHSPSLCRIPVQSCLPPCSGQWMCTGGSTACPRRGSSGSSAMTPIWSSSGWRRPSSAAGASLVTTTSTWMCMLPTCRFATRRTPTRTMWVSESNWNLCNLALCLWGKKALFTEYASKKQQICFCSFFLCVYLLHNSSQVKSKTCTSPLDLHHVSVTFFQSYFLIQQSHFLCCLLELTVSSML